MSLLQVDMTHVVEILSQIRLNTFLSYIVNIMAADVLATNGAKASATIFWPS